MPSEESTYAPPFAARVAVAMPMPSSSNGRRNQTKESSCASYRICPYGLRLRHLSPPLAPGVLVAGRSSRATVLRAFYHTGLRLGHLSPLPRWMQPEESSYYRVSYRTLPHEGYCDISLPPSSVGCQMQWEESRASAALRQMPHRLRCRYLSTLLVGCNRRKESTYRFVPRFILPHWMRLRHLFAVLGGCNRRRNRATGRTAFLPQGLSLIHI